jgi:hypothetical protein
MTTLPATVVALAVLSAAGLFPAAALVGVRWITVPLVPLCGSVVAAVSATCFLAVGGSFMGWFVGLATAGTAAVATAWSRWPRLRPRRARAGDAGRRGRGFLIGGIAGMAAVLGSCAWCLRGLATPTVGFDARAVWLLRTGWFLQSHQQLLVKMRVSDVPLIQSAYPPLVSASAAVAASVTGNQSIRLGVVVVALLNTSALVVAAFALLDAGRRFSARLSTVPSGDGAGPDDSRPDRAVGTAARLVRAAPTVVGVLAAVAVIFVAFGITEPFMTDGYADPLWSLAAVGAMAYGLQLGVRRPDQGAAFVLVLVAGMSKDEGLATGTALMVLIALRALCTMSADQRRLRWWRPVLVGAVELAALAAWPILIRVLHARGSASGHSPVATMPGRARATFDGMAPYLHVLVLAAPVAIVGGLVLARVRRASGVGNDGWSWAALAAGLLAIGGDLVVGVGAIQPWLESTVHRVTEFGALAGWWIVAMWAVVASGAPGVARLQGSSGPPLHDVSHEEDPSGQDVRGPGGMPVGTQARMDPSSAAT